MKWKDEDIEKYILNRLSADERVAFDKDLVESEDLKNRLRQVRTLTAGMQVGFNRELKQALQEHERHLKSAQKSHRIPIASRWPLLVAATLALLVVAAVIVVELRPPTPTSLYAAYYEPYPNVAQPLTRSLAGSEQALALYEGGRYTEAAESLESLRADGLLPEPVINFYTGICYMEIHDPNRAIDRFNAVIHSGHSGFVRPARWYLALAWLSLDNTEEAVKGLKSIAKGNDVYARKAVSLLGEL